MEPLTDAVFDRIYDTFLTHQLLLFRTSAWSRATR